MSLIVNFVSGKMSQQVEREALKRKRAQQRRITLLEYTKGQTFNQAEFKQRVAGGKC